MMYSWRDEITDEPCSSLSNLTARVDEADRTSLNLRFRTADPACEWLAIENQIIMPGASLPVHLTPFAYEQLCRLLNAPAEYLRTLPTETVVQLLNYHSHNTNPPIDRRAWTQMIQTGGGFIRGFVKPSNGKTPQYVLDSGVVRWVEWLRASFQELQYTQGNSFYYSSRGLGLFVASSESEVYVDSRYVLCRGLFIRNSEVGAWPLEVLPLLYDPFNGFCLFIRTKAGEQLYTQISSSVGSLQSSMFLALTVKNYLHGSSQEEQTLIQTALQHRFKNSTVALAFLKDRKFSGSAAAALLAETTVRFGAPYSLFDIVATGCILATQEGSIPAYLSAAIKAGGLL